MKKIGQIDNIELQISEIDIWTVRFQEWHHGKIIEVHFWWFMEKVLFLYPF